MHREGYGTEPTPSSRTPQGLDQAQKIVSREHRSVRVQSSLMTVKRWGPTDFKNVPSTEDLFEKFQQNWAPVHPFGLSFLSVMDVVVLES